ncbi:MAG: folate family ECF transporter S component [Bacillota bacterium]
MRTKTIVYVGLLACISVILTRYMGIMVPITGILGLRLSLGEIPLMLTGILFGPLAGGVAGAAADLIGMAVAPLGPYFPGFTLTAALTGVIPGLFLFRRKSEFTFLRLLVALAVTGLIVTFTNTIWLMMMSGKGIYALFPPRLLSRLLTIPVHTVIIWALHNRLRRLRVS